ncbi:MAG: hypothetical protein K8R99_10120 [Actinomycetia bacterium]|nr:hypothetical protein [Actinomycetes bacterium]
MVQPTLVAMSPAGDILITKVMERYWLNRSFAREPLNIEVSDVARIANQAGLDVVNLEFDSWAQLEAAVDERVERTPCPEIDASTWDEDEIEDALVEADELVARGDAVGARELLWFLCDLPQVLGDRLLHKSIEIRLRRLDKAAPLFQFANPHKLPVERALEQFQLAA